MVQKVRERETERDGGANHVFTGPAVPWMATRMIFKRRSLVVVAGINGDSAYSRHTTSRLVYYFFFPFSFPFFPIFYLPVGRGDVGCCVCSSDRKQTNNPTSRFSTPNEMVAIQRYSGQ
ncbi:hypothetical protein BDW42DRAFT_172037 [Aspergillus taichungensis]|uniref:Uncharacterized protein n=1 Tax=Aspergillus taichungensis TaxID=482145 RepID=A0A2J5HRG3_9EURO|nr:hypothetical protein BDW42DRAFT_172037 [Aspergillus taichungensis]